MLCVHASAVSVVACAGSRAYPVILNQYPAVDAHIELVSGDVGLFGIIIIERVTCITCHCDASVGRTLERDLAR